MRKQLLETIRRSRLTVLASCVLTLLTAGDPVNLARSGMASLVVPSSASSPAQSEDEESEAAKVKASAHAARRAVRKKHPLPPHPTPRTLPYLVPAPVALRLSFANPPFEHAYRNGVGAALRC